MKKKILLAVMLLFSVTCFAQKPAAQSDSLQVPADSIAFISAEQLVRFQKALNSVPHNQFVTLTPDMVIRELYVWAVREWNVNNQKAKPKK